jgi:hypothetical protein
MPVNVALLLLALFVPADAWRSAYRRGHQGMSGDDESTSSACAQFGVGERAASAANCRHRDQARRTLAARFATDLGVPHVELDEFVTGLIGRPGIRTCFRQWSASRRQSLRG